MLQNAYFLAKIGADTAENEQHLAEICQKLATTLRVRHPAVDEGHVRRAAHRDFEHRLVDPAEEGEGLWFVELEVHGEAIRRLPVERLADTKGRT